jgi:hypothetical protein
VRPKPVPRMCVVLIDVLLASLQQNCFFFKASSASC